MKLLIVSAKIVSPGSTHDGETKDIVIEDGIITAIKNNIPPKGFKNSVVHGDLHVSPGWFDMQADFCDPGYEYKEGIQNGVAAAAAGGITGVALSGSTLPPVHSKSQVEYIKKKAAGQPVDIYPVGVITHKQEGTDLAEMYDMHLSGAIAFSDDIHPLMNSGLMLRALLYAKSFNGLIMSRCFDTSLSPGTFVNEGDISVLTGIKGDPAIAEEMMALRNLYLAAYADVPIHLQSISTKGVLKLIKNAKKQGQKVTCSVNAYSLALEDANLTGFDVNYKTNPPLRAKEDMAALRKALQDGIIDVICSDHKPEDEESKKVEFDMAAPGITGIQTLYSLINMYSGLNTVQIIEKIAIRPREILGLKVPVINVGEKANLTLFSPSLAWTLDEKEYRSLSKNTPFMMKKLKGKALGIVNNGMVKIGIE
jgi:dihydroorotase